MIARLFALIGLIILAAGVVLPVACLDGSCEVFTDALFDPDRFEADTNLGIIGSMDGLIVLAVAIPALFGVISGDKGALIFSGLASAAVVGIIFGDVFLTIEDTDFSLAYGWAPLGIGSLLIVVGGLLARTPKPVVVAGPAAGPGMMAMPSGQGGMQKTMIDMGGAPAGGNMFKTAIDMNYAAQGQQPQYPQPPAYPQQPYPAQQPPYGQPQYPQQPQPQFQQPYGGGYEEPIDPSFKTMVDAGVGQPQPPAYNPPAYQSPPQPTFQRPPSPAAPQSPAAFDPNMKTQIDAIQPAKPVEVDPYAWQKAVPPEEPKPSYQEPKTPISPANLQAQQYSQELSKQQMPPSPAAPPPPPSNADLFKTNLSAEPLPNPTPSSGTPTALQDKTYMMPGGSATPPNAQAYQPPADGKPDDDEPPVDPFKTQIDLGK